MYAVTTRRQPAEPFSFGGRVLVHGDRAELEYLIPTHPVVELPGTTPEEVAARLGVPVMLWKDHPDMAAITWPLDRRRFR
jgi:hypothetical protein